ncbi:MAG: LPS export ABC transporter ATP-binding protein [gamma proteobacterium symbiont of Ctena orbiculata]|uniref:Lipopolysaccharide export system ATP-binding protein LptB n=1 Tax=Candidatus Thiodiazotropha taylori TaxID=2792791 RepID=A0A944M5K2_9GAMM|nr:LPS export ABC transporter ATP-binding protein [Candidatus Thiodiazotropha taylori]PUB85398.1 MAG: LPS export ABC transporter ATP-binding protein [gamma proteobacterium symbiont of Ctena orbiculata]MBT2987508.1 LPS export ABC transporter ATP-binding protein [Candidatus Thiodiazotropha taylori]MBT2995236.1 LPS export ABC transporter ATP-binding protein [Candidatus Thiodiazotropha taylori]MBT2999845.1 LPS export ABC transporter ATP-binding protein [Candidatus Thiodiazotropha taylori]
MSRLQAKALQKQYGKRNVVDGVSLSVNSGEVVGLLGPNGAGKTTSFYMIVGLIEADRGEILLDSEVLTDQAMHKRARSGIGYLAQEASVFRRLTVEQNILAILETRDELDAAEGREICDRLLTELGIDHLRESLAMSLSGGERRRLEIARTLSVQPRFVLLDEPFAGVDPLAVIDIKKIIQHLKALQIGVLITDHNVRETLDICDRAYIINSGRVLAEGTTEQILRNEEVRNVYLGEDFSM